MSCTALMSATGEEWGEGELHCIDERVRPGNTMIWDSR